MTDHTPDPGPYGQSSATPAPQPSPYVPSAGDPQPSPYQGQGGYVEQAGPQYAPPGYGQPANVGQQPYTAQGYGQPYGYGQPAPMGMAGGMPMVGAKSKIAAGLLGIFLGSLGVHNFYLGHTGKGVAQLLITVLTFGFGAIITGIWGIIEGIMILASQPGTPWACDARGVPLTN